MIYRHTSCGTHSVDHQLLGLVPQPAKALIMCFPITPELDKAEKEVDDRISKDGQHPLDPSLVFIKQTVSASCSECWAWQSNRSTYR